MNRDLLRQAQQLQAKMMKAQQELEATNVEASVGGGVIKVVVSGKMKLVSIKIDPQAVDPNDVQGLEDLVMAAVNEGLKKAEDMANAKMSSLTGGMKLPGM